MTDNDLWAIAREYDEDWPDDDTDAARMARLALKTQRQMRWWRESAQRGVPSDRYEKAEADLAAARAEVADRDRRLAAVQAVLADAECAECHPTADREDTPCGPMCALRQKVRSALGGADTLAAHDERVRAQEREAVLDEVEAVVPRIGWGDYFDADGELQYGATIHPPIGVSGEIVGIRQWVRALRTQDGGLCWDKGPRIGGDGSAFCKQPKGHDGPHRPDPDDGWGPISWPRLRAQDGERL